GRASAARRALTLLARGAGVAVVAVGSGVGIDLAPGNRIARVLRARIGVGAVERRPRNASPALARVVDGALVVVGARRVVRCGLVAARHGRDVARVDRAGIHVVAADADADALAAHALVAHRARVAVVAGRVVGLADVLAAHHLVAAVGRAIA